MTESTGGKTIGTTGAAPTPEPADVGMLHTLPASVESGGVVPGHRVGRFVITGLLGSGGMGEVYGARDPELDRPVAIKVLRPELLTRSDARLRREARAMARLSHPNLVTVHEVGVDHGKLFIAMELIDGMTLRQWARGKSWREIVRVYVAAGRGLAAAHEAGIVHRDFKPDNVLVGDDGRVAVSDFGLARTDETSDEPDPEREADDQLTQAGALLGTLRYMAPEQLDRRSADARSDQFAFCVSLWEALDAHPYDPGRALRSSDACREAIAAGLPRAKFRDVPRRIVRTLLRGLANKPSDRWPDMPELLRQLDAAVARRRRIILGTFVLGLVAIAISATWLVREPATDPCADVTAGLGKVWQPSERPRIAAAFATTGRPGAADTATRVGTMLDQRAAEWAALRISTCVATKADGAQRLALHSRQAACLETQLHQLDALVAGLTTAPTGATVDRAIRATSELAPVSACADVGALLDQPTPPRDPAIGARIDRLGELVARAWVRDALAGDIVELADYKREAAALAWDPLLASTAYLDGEIAYRKGDNAAAERSCREAALAGARAHDDALVARALSLASEAVSTAGRPKEAVELALAARIASARAGAPGALEAEVEISLADAYAAGANFDDSDRAYARAIELFEATGAPADQLGRTLNNWANQLEERSDYARSVPLSDRAVVLVRQALGNHHPDLARALQSNGTKQLTIRNYALARERFEEAYAIKLAVYGPTDPTVAMSLHGLGELYTYAPTFGDLPRAVTYYQRAIDIWAAKSGPASKNVLMARFNLAMNLEKQGKYAESLAIFEDLLKVREANPDTSPLKIANTLDGMAAIHADLGHNATAIELATRSLAIREKVAGPETSDVADSLSTLATLWSEAGDCAKARPAAARILAILAKQPNGDRGPTKAAAVVANAVCAGRDGKLAVEIAGYRDAIGLLADEPADRGATELELASLLWKTDRPAARTLVDAARADLGHDTKVDRWLAAHPER